MPVVRGDNIRSNLKKNFLYITDGKDLEKGGLNFPSILSNTVDYSFNFLCCYVLVL